jgi:hypothetical protein
LPGEKDGTTVRSKVLFKIPFLLNTKINYASASPKRKSNAKTSINEKVKEGNEIVDRAKPIAKNNSDIESVIQSTEIKELPKNFSCDMDVCAKPKDGIKAILENFVLPSIIKRKKLEGEVIVETTVDIYGNVRDTKVLGDIGYGSGIAVEVAILQTKFEPGMQNGKAKDCVVKIKVPIIQPKAVEGD